MATLPWRAPGGWDWCLSNGEDGADGACQDGMDVTSQSKAETHLESAKDLKVPAPPPPC